MQRVNAVSIGDRHTSMPVPVDCSAADMSNLAASGPCDSESESAVNHDQRPLTQWHWQAAGLSPAGLSPAAGDSPAAHLDSCQTPMLVSQLGAVISESRAVYPDVTVTPDIGAHFWSCDSDIGLGVVSAVSIRVGAFPTRISYHDTVTMILV